jgi:3-isopropylmalate dehydrogenase
MAKIALIPGDGAGIEVAEAARRVLEKVAPQHELVSFDYGAERYLKTGVGMPPGQIEVFKNEYDAILFGAVGDARVKDNAHAREILLGLRFGLDLYVNFRPCRLLDDRHSVLKGKGRREIDFVVFRENTEGMYNAIGGVFKKGTPDEVAVAEEINTRKGVKRIIEAAFAWAKNNGKKRVALADKSNAIAAHELWLRTFKEIASGYPEISARHYYVDAIAMQLVVKPEDFDVIVTTNLFGDILTDLGAALTGGMGLAPSANLNPESTPLFEPVHGSAPDIAGKNQVNPVAMLLSTALMLRELNDEKPAAAIEHAVESAVQAQKTTRDLGGTLSTTEATAAVVERL